MPFSKATKTAAKLRLALAGPSGSGKTFTALTLGCALGTRVAVIDTERGSASKYADLFSFDVLELDSFSPLAYVAAIQEASAAGYDVVIVDSLTQAWAGKGGALELVDTAAKQAKSSNTYFAWREVTPLHNQLVDALVGCPAHLIATLRSKVEYLIETTQQGKSVPRRVGMAPIQREGLEYEFDLFGEMDRDNTLLIQKSRCPELSGVVIPKPSGQLAETLKAWLAGAPVPAQPQRETPAASPPVITDGQRKRLFALTGKAKIADATLKAWLLNTYGYTSTSQIAQSHYDAICGAIEHGAVTVPVDAPVELITVRELEALTSATKHEGIPPAAFDAFLHAAYGCTAATLPLAEYGHVLDQVTGGYVAQWCQDNQSEVAA